MLRLVISSVWPRALSAFMGACCMSLITKHLLTQRKKNFGLLEEFVECMANNGVDVCGQVGSNWVHASGLGVDGIKNFCARLSDTYELSLIHI